MLSLILFLTLGALAGIGFFRSFSQLKSIERGSERSGQLLKKFDRLKSALEQGAAGERLARLLIEKCEEFRNSPPATSIPADDSLDKAVLLLHGVLGEIRKGNQPVSALETARDAMAQYLNRLNDEGNSVRPKLVNPVSLIAGGITALLMLPLKPFKYFGLLDQEKLNSLESGLVIRLVSQAGSIVGLISTALSIIFQWLDYYQGVFNALQY